MLDRTESISVVVTKTFLVTPQLDFPERCSRNCKHLKSPWWGRYMCALFEEDLLVVFLNDKVVRYCERSQKCICAANAADKHR